ncbi:MAG TPA: ABC transporter permease [Allosphingosinicella sp.]|jgi:putative ABC transport system permease protein
MVGDLIRTAFKSVMNNRFHAGLNVAGLATGLAAAILLLLYVRDEMTFDRAFPADAYRISSSITMPGGQTVVFDGTDYALAEGMKLDLPQISTVARMMPQDWTVRRGDVEFNETIYWADATLFSVLPASAVAGDPKTALDRPNSLVLTRTMARRLFGKDAPLGETLQFNREHLMEVTAVIRDLPSNSHVAGRIFASGKTPFSNLAALDADTGGFHFDGTTYTYFRLRPGASLEAVRAALPDLVVNRLHIPKENAFGVAVTLSAIPIRDIHFAPAGINAMKAPGDKATVAAAGIIALLILVGACVNFVNLTTARVSGRAIEVAVRKAAGASRANLALQFITEAILQVAAAMVLALAAVELLLPSFNAFLEREILFAYWRPEMLASLLIAVVGVGLLAGAYPALVLSALRPAVAMRGGPSFLDRGRLRRALVVVQFAILTGLVISTAIIWRQTQFAAESAGRLSAYSMVLVSAPCTDALKNGLAKLPDVESAACSEPTMMDSERAMEMIEISPARIHSFETLSVEPGFLEAYGLRPLAGRMFDLRYGGDVVTPPGPTPQEVRMVINRTAVRELGLRQPRAAIGLRLQASAARGSRFFTVIGVVPDFPTGSVRVPTAPTAYFVDPARFGMLTARVRPGRMANALAGIRDVWLATGQEGLPKMLPLEVYATGLYREIVREGVIFAIAAGVTLLIACIGLFGMASFMAEQRTKEIGIRKALGASTRQVATLLLWQFSRPVVWANLIAWPIVWLLMSRWLSGFAYHVPLQPWPFLAGGVLTLAITLATVGGQAFLVARRPPATALRYE